MTRIAAVRTVRRIVAGALLALLGGLALAHDESGVLYLAESGIDAGDCRAPARACRTFEYALARAGKGDEVRVAAGRYTFRPDDPAEIAVLLSSVVPVRGGYSLDEDYRRQTPLVNPTRLMGPASEHAAELLERGFLLAPAGADPTALQAGRELYVAEGGEDVGDCGNRDVPCGGLAYAAGEADAGDVIRVAAGDYALGEDDLAQLLARGVELRGGFSANDGFLQPAAADDPSYLVGPSFRSRDDLAALGFTLVQDRKGIAIEESIEERAGDEIAPVPAPAVVPCDPPSGTAGPYPCDGVDLLARVPLSGFSSDPGAANDIWGFVDLDDGREYALIGLLNGTAVVDVSDPLNPVEVGTVPGRRARWRDIKVLQTFDEEAGRWNAWAYVTADFPDAAQGLQILDLNDLPNSVSLAAASTEFFVRAHNIYLANVDYASGAPLTGMEPFAYVLGGSVSLGGGDGRVRILELSDPLAPTLATPPPSGSQYVHDATSLVLTGPRTDACRSGSPAPPAGHDPCELYVDFNEDTVDLWDVTDKSAPLRISSTPYPNAGYVHSGWWNADRTTIYIQDELDEQAGLNTTLRAMDITDLANPTVSVVWTGPTRAIDHNGFAHEGRYYMSNYRRGLTVFDLGGAAPSEIAFFDTFPSPAADSAAFNGAWGVYPFLPSGTLLVSDIENGLFLLRLSSGEVGTAREPSHAYAAKLVCGVQEDEGELRFAAGSYATTINIVNPGPDPVVFEKRLALAFPPGGQEPGETFRIAEDRLEPGEALAVDCPDVAERVFGGALPAPLIDGFVTLAADGPLDVVAVYSARPLGGDGGPSVDVERVPERRTGER